MIYLRSHHLRLLSSYILAKKSPFGYLENKKIRIIKSAVEEGHTKTHGVHIIEILEKALDLNEKIKLVDTIDNICETCDKKSERACREFIPYDLSATSDDRAELYFYGLQKRVYTSKFLQKRLSEKGFS